MKLAPSVLAVLSVLTLPAMGQVTCSTECPDMMSAAQVWVSDPNHASYRIQIATDSIIQTFSGNGHGYALSVTKTPLGNGTYSISLKVSGFGYISAANRMDASQLTASFYQTLNQLKAPTPTPTPLPPTPQPTPVPTPVPVVDIAAWKAWRGQQYSKCAKVAPKGNKAYVACLDNMIDQYVKGLSDASIPVPKN